MRLYVSNLAWSIRDEELKQIFEQYGEVKSAKVILDRETERSRGFGFVEMATQQACDDAIHGLHEAEIKGRSIRVELAKESPRRSSPRY